MSAENKAIVRRFFEEAWNKQNPGVLDALVASNASHHDPTNPSVAPGPAGQKDILKKYTSAFPDCRLSIEQMIAEGDLVTVRYTARGTHRGTLEGIEPTGREVTVSGILIARIAQGKLAESWVNFDALGLMQQLGAVARPAKA